MVSKRRPPRPVSQHTDKYSGYPSLQRELTEQQPEVQHTEPQPMPFPDAPTKGWCLWRPLEHRTETLASILQIYEKLQDMTEEGLVIPHPDKLRLELISHTMVRLALGPQIINSRLCHEQVQKQMGQVLAKTIEVPKPEIQVHSAFKKEQVPAIDIRLGFRRKLNHEAATAVQIANNVGHRTTLRPLRHVGVRIAHIRNRDVDFVEQYKEALGSITLAPLALGPLQVPHDYPPLTIPLQPLDTENI